MCNLSFCCPHCGNRKFVFTVYCQNTHTRHGAACAKCGAYLSPHSCLIYNGSQGFDESEESTPTTLKSKNWYRRACYQGYYYSQCLTMQVLVLPPIAPSPVYCYRLNALVMAAMAWIHSRYSFVWFSSKALSSAENKAFFASWSALGSSDAATIRCALAWH